MTLHDAISKVLREKNRPMTAREIAHEINSRILYQRGDRNPVPSSQIHARVNKRPHLFYKEKVNNGNDLIGLKQWQYQPPSTTESSEPPGSLTALPETREALGFEGDVMRASFLPENGFRAVGIIRNLFRSGLPKLPELNACGLYAITVPKDYVAGFIEPDEASEDGNVIRPWDLDRLEEKWVPGAAIVYFGIAGAKSERPLRKRLRDLLRHGRGDTTDRGPHKGGEILWQLERYGTFTIWILPTAGPPVPREIENQILKRFHKATGKLPFANRQF